MICYNNSTLVFPIYTFSMAGNIIVYTPSQSTNREKYFNHTIYKETMPTLTGKKTLFYQFLPSEAASFPSFDNELRA